MRPVLIDEWQHIPETWDLIRRAVDAGASPGSFFLTGSSRPIEGGSHSGAGRILSLRMRPLALTAYAAASSTATSFERIRDAASGGQGEKSAKSTTIPYRDVLERLWILDPVEAWSPSRNRLSRLSSPRKHQLADPALAARLLGVDADALLEGRTAGPPIPRDGTLLDALLESLVTLSVRTYAQAAEATVKHLRMASGEREVDLIVERADGMVITTGPEAYRRPDGIAVVPAALLGP